MTTTIQHVGNWWKSESPIPPPDWLLISFSSAVFLLLAASTLNHSSYFLHFDTPTQHLAGELFLKGQWAYNGNKALIMWILAGLTRLFGVNPLNETIFLCLLGTAATAAFTDFAYLALQNRRLALLSVLLWLGLGSTLYYFRMHIGYPLGFYLIGLAFYQRRHFAIGGFALLLAVLSHTSFVTPVMLWIGITTLLGVGPRSWVDLITLCSPMIGGYLAYEYIALQFTTEIWHTTKNFLGEVGRWSDYVNPDQQITYPWYLFKAANGIPATWFLTLVLLGYPLTTLLNRSTAFSPAKKIRYAAYLSSTALFAYFIIRSGIWQQMTILRIIVGATPLAILAGVDLLVEFAESNRVAKTVIGLVLILGIPVHITFNALEQAYCSWTAYPTVAAMFEQAAEQNKTVLYFGNPWVGAYFRQVSGSKVLINPPGGPLADETANTFTLDDLPSDASTMIIWEERNLSNLESTLQALDIQELTSAKDSNRITHQIDRCAITIPESWAPTTEVLQTAHPLTQWHEPSDPNTIILIWESRHD